MVSDDIAHACHDGERVDAQAMSGNRPGWMDHWMHTKSCMPASSNCDLLSVGCKVKEVKEDSVAKQNGSLGGSGVAVDSSMRAGEQNNLAVSTLLSKELVQKSDSAVAPNVRDRGKGLMSPFTSGQHEIYPSSCNLASEENFVTTKYHSYSSLLIREKKMSSLLVPQARRSSFPKWIEGGIEDSDDEELYFIRGQFCKIQSYTANTNIKNQTASLESTKSRKFCGRRSLVPQLPCSVHDVKTTKIYTSVDSVEESSRCLPKISQTTHRFLMSKKTDVNLSDGGRFLREPIAPTKFKGNSFNLILDLSPDSPPANDQCVEGVNLEALGSSINSEGKDNVQGLRSSTSPKAKNESSAETDTMDIHALHENHLPGDDVPLQTKKCSKDSQNSPISQVAVTSAAEKSKAKSINTTLPNINHEPPEHDLPLASPVADKETSTSRTHSLSVERLLSQSFGTNPSSRWVKRLKLCTLGSAHGTKNADIGESSSREKVNICTTNMKGTENISETKVVYCAEEQMVPDPPATVVTNGKLSSTEAKRAVEITLSHPWIQRWSNKRSASFQERHELVDLNDSKSSDSALEELQKKQFPSIVAMAMMGKAMNSLNNPSGLMKKGPVMIWNAKGFGDC